MSASKTTAHVVANLHEMWRRLERLEADNARLREAIRIASILVDDDFTTPAAECLQAALEGTAWKFGTTELLPAAPAPAASA